MEVGELLFGLLHGLGIRTVLASARARFHEGPGPRVSVARVVRAALPLALLPTLAWAGDFELLPEVTVQLRGAYYAPPEDAFVWNTWIGAGAGLLRAKATTGYITIDVETILGRERRLLDANQANYHLEGGLRLRAGRHLVIPFFHHVSRHLVDRPKTQLVDWNLLGLRAAGPLPQRLPITGCYAASVGHTVHWRTVGYEWELRVVLDIEVLRRSWGIAYLRADTRFVTVEDQPRFPRGDFADLLGEGGVRLGPVERSLDLFLAYEHRNDVLLLSPGARDRALFGLRVGFAPRGSATPILPVSFPGPPLR